MASVRICNVGNSGTVGVEVGFWVELVLGDKVVVDVGAGVLVGSTVAVGEGEGVGDGGEGVGVGVGDGAGVGVGCCVGVGVSADS